MSADITEESSPVTYIMLNTGEDLPFPVGFGLHIQLVACFPLKSNLRWLPSTAYWQSELQQRAFRTAQWQSSHSPFVQPLLTNGELMSKSGISHSEKNQQKRLAVQHQHILSMLPSHRRYCISSSLTWGCRDWLNRDDVSQEWTLSPFLKD